MDWTFPYPSQRMPVFGRNVVATSQPLAVQAGLETMRAGGNAVDAAIAAAATLTVVEPTSNGIGSDAFALVWDGAQLHGLNASGRSPKRWTPERFASLPAMPETGWDAVTVPGCVAAWRDLSERFGKLPFERLLAPAIHYADAGHHVSPITSAAWQRAAVRFAEFPDFQRAFCPQGRAPQPGELFRCEGQAETLRRIASSKGVDFYEGETARRIAGAARNADALLDEEDLAAHRNDWVEPIAHEFEKTAIHEIPPNGQGLAALIALGILNYTPLKEYPTDSADFHHVQIEAIKLAFADAHRYIADPTAMELRPADLLNEDYLASRAVLIDPERAQDFEHGLPRDKGTVYLAAADSDGMMVSFIQSNFDGFGSGIVVPGTGVSLQNRAHGFVTTPGHPNGVDGGKRPFHTIIPGFMMRDGAPLAAFGVMGGSFQAQGHMQTAVRILQRGQNPQAASDAPRWRVGNGRTVALEKGFPLHVAQELDRRGHALEWPERGNFGGAQFIFRNGDGYCAASDHRKDGHAAGY